MAAVVKKEGKRNKKGDSGRLKKMKTAAELWLHFALGKEEKKKKRGVINAANCAAANGKEEGGGEKEASPPVVAACISQKDSERDRN